MRCNRILRWVAAMLVAVASGNIAYGQKTDSLTLNKCYTLAVDYSTLTQQKSLQQQVTGANVKKTNADWFPEAEINGQASYQSNVTSIPISIEGLESISKDQYKATLDLTQVIYDGGYVNRQKQLYKTGLQIEQTKLDVDIQRLKERINGLYLSVLLIDDNIQLVKILRKDILINIEKLSAMLKNGIALKSNVDILEAELMKADQKLIELTTNKKSTIEMLSILVGQELSENTIFTLPLIEANVQDTISNRPEYKLFDLQKASLENQSSIVSTKNMPKLYLFASGGYGRPGLNMLSNDFEWFGIAGIKLSIPLTNWKKTRYEKQAVLVQQSIIDAQKEDFNRNNKIEINRQLNEIDKYEQLLEKDRAIVDKRTSIKETAAAKLENGVITSDDYISDLNAKNQALLNLKLHEIQLIQAIINLNSLKGNN